MRAFKRASDHSLTRPYLQLWQTHKKSLKTFSTLYSQFRQMIQGDFRYLKSHFQQENFGLFNGAEPRIMGTLWKPKSGTPLPPSIGALVVAPDISEDEINHFWQNTKNLAPEGLVGPLNGHHYFGFSVAPEQASAENVGFLTAAPFKNQKRFFQPVSGDVYRRYFSFETHLTQDRIEKYKSELKENQNFQIRYFNRWRSRRDLNDLNQIVNQAFISHFDFAPMSDEENWELMKSSSFLLRPHHLMFLEYKGKPVAFSLALLDYNRVLNPQAGDFQNTWHLLTARQIRRARLVHIGILPEFQGQGLIKIIRHRQLLALAAEGVSVVENSYIDEGNQNSLGNVISNGGQKLNQFEIYRF